MFFNSLLSQSPSTIWEDWSKSYKIDLESFMRHQYLTQKTPECCPRHMIWDQEHHHVDWCLAQNPEPLGVVWRRCDGGATTPTFTWEAHRFGTLFSVFFVPWKNAQLHFKGWICPVCWVRDHSKLIHWGNPKWWYRREPAGKPPNYVLFIIIWAYPLWAFWRPTILNNAQSCVYRDIHI